MSLRELAAAVAAALARPVYGGAGCIVSLHRVTLAAERSRLSDNRALELTPEAMRAVLKQVQHQGLEPVSMDEVVERIANPRARKFIAFTFDDGYRDNLELALPIFREFSIPFTVFLSTDFVSRRSAPWWYELDHILHERSEMVLEDDGKEIRYELNDAASRERAFYSIARQIRRQGIENRETLLNQMRSLPGSDSKARAADTIMTWEEVRKLSLDSLVTIGCHTAGHHTLSLMSDADLCSEMTSSRAEISERLAIEVKHLAYPFGSPGAVGAREVGAARACGFETASTTRSANVFPGHLQHLHALPRLCLAGTYPDPIVRWRKLESGLIPAKAHRGRRVVTV